jgi:tetratricopeptide (TPR) repeat protein
MAGRSWLNFAPFVLLHPHQAKGTSSWLRLRRFGLGLTLLTAGLLVTTRPAVAMVPFVFVPQPEALEGAGRGIAQAAAKLLRFGQPEDAARLADLTVRLLPNEPIGWVLLAEAELRSNRSEQALKALEKAKRLDPNNPGIWFAEGAVALRNNRPADALVLLRRGLQLDNQNAGAHFDLGNAYFMLSQPNEAMASFNKAASLRKNFWEAINNQGLVLFELDRRSEAMDRWRKVLISKPDVAETSLALGSSLLLTNPQKRDEALRLAKNALNEDPNYVKESYQKDQLWGPKLRAAARNLLSQPELKSAVERASANANGSSSRPE